jgi:hypothetical protein
VWRAALLYLALAVVATWPLARQLDTSVPHDLGDPLLVTYLLNWNARVMPFSEAWWHPPFFWPARHVLVLSEHLLGLSIVASPLIWLGLSPLAAYNVLFVASFWTAGIGGWVLGRTLTGQGAAAWLCGLVFMFAPYRFSHLPHLQILFSCGVPLLFAALHHSLMHLQSRAAPPSRDPKAPTRAPSSTTPSSWLGRWRWPIVVVACWIWQGLVSGYFLAFLPIGIVLWLIWFAPRAWPLWGRLAAVGSLGALTVAPLLWRYAVLQETGGYRRGLHEVLEFSADVAGLWQVSDRLSIWGRLLPKGYTEEQLFPGLATLALAAVALRTLPRAIGRMRAFTATCLAVAAIFASAAAIAVLIPGAFTFLGADVSLHNAHKPLGLAWLAFIGAVVSSRTFTSAWRQRSVAGGYVVLAVVSWILTLGPAPTMNGEPVWYLAPYSWLYTYVPGFTAFRVPARLFVLTTVALAALAAVGTERILRWRRSAAVATTALLSVAVVAEGWLARMPLAAAPRPIAIPVEAVAVLELPTGDAGRDATAMYRSLFHGRPVLNGWSGYRPASAAATARVDAGDVHALLDWARLGPLAIVIHRDVPHAARYEGMVEHAGATCQAAGEALVCLVRPPAPGH